MVVAARVEGTFAMAAACMIRKIKRACEVADCTLME
jgi:5,10-methenyltetrahydromethanopterin hydrogenase